MEMCECDLIAEIVTIVRTFNFIKEEKEMYSDYEPLRIPNGYRELKNIDSVFISGRQNSYYGWPDEDDESHNCDAMGCSSVSRYIQSGFMR